MVSPTGSGRRDARGGRTALAGLVALALIGSAAWAVWPEGPAGGGGGGGGATLAEGPAEGAAAGAGAAGDAGASRELVLLERPGDTLPGPARVGPAAAEPAVEPLGGGEIVPSIDTVRAEPDGSALIAGRATPGALVRIIVDGREVAEAHADGRGQFVTFVSFGEGAGARVIWLVAEGADGVGRRSEGDVILAQPQVRVAGGPDAAGGAPKAMAQAMAQAMAPALADTAAAGGGAPKAGARAATQGRAGGLAAAPQVGAPPPAGDGASPATDELAPDAPSAAATQTAGAAPRTGLAAGGVASGTASDAMPQAADAMPQAAEGMPQAVDVTTQAADATPQAADVTTLTALAPRPAARPGRGAGGERAPVSGAAALPRAVGAAAPAVETGPAVPPAGEVASAPAAPTVLLSDSAGIRPLGSPPLAPGEPLRIDTIAYGAADDVILRGRRDGPGPIELSLDGRVVAEALAGDDGTWSAVLSGVAPGDYRLSVGRVDPAGGVRGRIAVPFRRAAPEELARAAIGAGDAGPVTVQPGSTLWGIARERYGDGLRYVEVFDANRSQIEDPDLIYPGQVFELPR